MLTAQLRDLMVMISRSQLPEQQVQCGFQEGSEFDPPRN